MTRILLLGGTGEALALARRLAEGHELTYSLAGRARMVELPCKVRVGGFGGVAGLAAFMENARIELLIDATHPYAVRISANAAEAAKQTNTLLWAYRRPPWRPETGDDWRTVRSWAELETALAGFQRPFFTIGLEPLRYVEMLPAAQRWLVRTLAMEHSILPRLTLIHGIGPFDLTDELAVMRTHEVDVLVTKNSGGKAVAAKLEAARRLGIPVLMFERPPLPAVDREFIDIASFARCLGC